MWKHNGPGTISGVAAGDLSDEEFEAALERAVQGWLEEDRAQALEEMRQSVTTPPADEDGTPTGAPAMYAHETDGTPVAATSRIVVERVDDGDDSGEG